MPSVPNKPMVPTAASAPITSPPRPLRRHIGQSLGGSDERGAANHRQQNTGYRRKPRRTNLGQDEREGQMEDRMNCHE